MKVKRMMTFLTVVLIAFMALQLMIRIAPSKPENWVISETGQAPGDYPSDGGFRVVRSVEDASAFTQKFEQAMLAEPGTQKLGQMQGQDIYISRSAFWGFPDYTTLVTDDERAEIYARLRFGKSDMGVNRARLERVLGRIEDPATE